MNTILDQGILGHPGSQRTYWGSDVNRNAPHPASASAGPARKSLSSLWSSLKKG